MRTSFSSFALVLLDDPVACGQPESNPLANRLGGEKWIEDLVADLITDPFSIIETMDLNPIGNKPGRDGHLASVGAGVDGIAVFEY